MMSGKLTKLGGLLASVAVIVAAIAAAPDPALAASGYRLALGVAPNPDISGDPLTIYGTLSNRAGLPVDNVRIILMHRVNPAPTFTVVQRGRTGAGGLFQFNRAEGVVVSNRAWYALALSPSGRVLARSAIVRERVYAELTLSASAADVETGHPITFSGAVTPAHAGARVILERQVGATGTAWRRIGAARIDAGGGYALTRSFARPSESGALTIRALLPGDARNIRSYSEAVSVTVQQAERPDLTLSPSAPAITVGESIDLSGRLSSPSAGSAGAQRVTLYERVHGGPLTPVAESTTNGEGGFSFNVAPLRNTAYQVRAGGLRSAFVYEGVHDAISAQASASSGTVGSFITVEGQVTPAHEGHVVFLQLRNSAGHYQTLQATYVGAGSRYVFSHQLHSAGTKVYRVYIPGGPENLGAASPPFTVDVAPVPVLPKLQSTPSGEEE